MGYHEACIGELSNDFASGMKILVASKNMPEACDCLDRSESNKISRKFVFRNTGAAIPESFNLIKLNFLLNIRLVGLRLG